MQHSEGRACNVQRTVVAPARFLSVACGRRHTLLLTMDGRLFSCGASDAGQLGHCAVAVDEKGNTGAGIVSDSLSLRRVVQCDEVEAGPGLPCAVRSVGAGGDQSVAVTVDGAVYTWGARRCASPQHAPRQLRIPHEPDDDNCSAGGHGTEGWQSRLTSLDHSLSFTASVADHV